MSKFVDGPIRGIVNVSQSWAVGQSVTLGCREWLVLTENADGPKFQSVSFPPAFFDAATEFNTKAYGVDNATPICAWATAKRIGSGVFTVVLDNGETRQMPFTIRKRVTAEHS
jgi:hypothetical protein